MTCENEVELTIVQGATFAKTFTWYSGTQVIKAITAITKAYPPVFTAAAHGLPTASCPCRIESVLGMVDINTEPGEHVFALKVDAGTFSIPLINAAEFDTYTSGGYVIYTPPKDLSTYTARMQIRATQASTGFLIELTTANGGITLGADGTIVLAITATATAAYATAAAVYDLELISGAGTVTRLFSGAVTLSKEVTR